MSNYQKQPKNNIKCRNTTLKPTLISQKWRPLEYDNVRIWIWIIIKYNIIVRFSLIHCLNSKMHTKYFRLIIFIQNIGPSLDWG